MASRLPKARTMTKRWRHLAWSTLNAAGNLLIAYWMLDSQLDATTTATRWFWAFGVFAWCAITLIEAHRDFFTLPRPERGSL